MTKYRQITHTDLRLAIIKNDGVECEQVPHVFFPEELPPHSERNTAIALAKEICARCPIIDVCREYALTNREEFGVWAGLLPSER